MVPDSDEINLSTVELQVLTELDRLVKLNDLFLSSVLID